MSSDEKIKHKIYNAVILGPSSSGRTSVANYLAEKYKGERISLDGVTSNGRPINTVVSMNKSTQFTNDEIGILIRQLMIKEAKQATKQSMPWFIDDIDNYIYDILPKTLRPSTKLIIIIPTINKIIKNVIQRNKEATVAPEERRIINVLKQLRGFVSPHLVRTQDIEKLLKDPKKYIISNHEIINACEHDKMHYSISEKKNWEDDTNDILAKFGLKSMKSKKLQYIDLIPINFGQNSVILNNGSMYSLIKKVENEIKV